MPPNSRERLARRVAPDATVLGHRVLRGGVSARVEVLELALPSGGIRRVVVRQPGAADGKGTAADAAHTEHALLEALHGAGLPVPEPLFLDDGGGADPACLVMVYVEGTTELPDALLPDALRTMASFLARLHALDAASLPLPSLPPREDPVAGALEFLPALPMTEALRAALRGLSLEASNPSVLLHGDFWPGNVLWNGGAIAAVLDWEDAALGDPLCDLAGARVELTWRQGERAADAFTEAYLALAPIDLFDLPVWELFVASAGAASMGEWGLAPDVETQMRRRTERILERAGDAVLERR